MGNVEVNAEKVLTADKDWAESFSVCVCVWQNIVKFCGINQKLMIHSQQ